MVFWIAILAGVLFAWLAIRMGFYETWALLFNVIVSLYVAVFLAAALARVAPASPYSVAFSLIVLAGGCFALLQGLSYVFLTGQFSVRFPRFFDILGAGALGFVNGFLILTFVALVVTASPLSRRRVVSDIGLNPQAQDATLSPLAWCCDRIHTVAGFAPHEDATRKAVQHLLELSQQMTPPPSATESDPNAPPAKRPQTTKPQPKRLRDPADMLERL